MGIKKGIGYKGLEEWGYGLLIKRLKINRNRTIDLIVVNNNGKVKYIVEALKEDNRENEQGWGDNNNYR